MKNHGLKLLAMKISPSLKLLGEATRYEVLAAQLALKAVTGDPAKRAENERLARDHAIRAETYAAAARLLANSERGTGNAESANRKSQIVNRKS